MLRQFDTVQLTDRSIHFLVQIWRNKNQIQEQRMLMWKEKRYNVVQSTQWAKQKVILIHLRPRDDQLQLIVCNLRPIKLSTLFSHELLTFIFVSRHFRSHHPNKACLFLKRIATSFFFSRFEKKLFLVKI